MQPDEFLQSRNSWFTFRETIHHWEGVAESLARGELQYYDDYLNDLAGRNIIEEVLNDPRVEVCERDAEKVRKSDAIVRGLLVPVDKGFGLHVNPAAEELPEKYWWHYGRPLRIDATFESFLGGGN